MAEVHLHEGESLESAFKRFKQKVLQEEIIKDIKSHAFYLKPGQEEARQVCVGTAARPQEAFPGR